MTCVDSRQQIISLFNWIFLCVEIWLIYQKPSKLLHSPADVPKPWQHKQVHMYIPQNLYGRFRIFIFSNFLFNIGSTSPV